jgi:alpha-methylacyl-CoA racemase
MTGGPLAGIRVLEIAGLGPTPFTGMMLADMGADVLRLERPTGRTIRFVPDAYDVPSRGRRSVAIDLKADGAAELVLDLVRRSDVLIEGYRPGVCERLGIGPEPCLAVNPRLVYTRITGWGQDGPRAHLGGHDINYIAVTGALGAIGERGRKPVPPLNLLGDFGGGGMLAVTGTLAALVEVQRHGRGQVVDAAMIDGVSSLLATTYGYASAGVLSAERESNYTDGGAPFYRTYECSDGGYVAVGAVETVFFTRLVQTLGVAVRPEDQRDKAQWAQQSQLIGAAFAARSRDEWAAVFTEVDACVSPVLTFREAAADEQVAARATLITRDGVTQPAPAPRFGGSAASLGRPPRSPGADTTGALMEWGVPAEEVGRLLTAGVVLHPAGRSDSEGSDADGKEHA